MQIMSDELAQALLDLKKEHPETALGLAIGAAAVWLVGDLVWVLGALPGLVSMHNDGALIAAVIGTLFMLWLNAVGFMAVAKLERLSRGGDE